MRLRTQLAALAVALSPSVALAANLRHEAEGVVSPEAMGIMAAIGLLVWMGDWSRKVCASDLHRYNTNRDEDVEDPAGHVLSRYRMIAAVSTVGGAMVAYGVVAVLS